MHNTSKYIYSFIYYLLHLYKMLYIFNNQIITLFSHYLFFDIKSYKKHNYVQIILYQQVSKHIMPLCTSYIMQKD